MIAPDPTVEHMATLVRLREQSLGTPPPRHGDPSKTGPAAPGLPSSPPDPQAALPGIAPGERAPRSSTHRFGLLRWETVPATALDEEHVRSVETCKHCPCQRRRANTGARMGAQTTFSTDGETWSLASPPCIPKARRA